MVTKAPGTSVNCHAGMQLSFETSFKDEIKGGKKVS